MRRLMILSLLALLVIFLLPPLLCPPRAGAGTGADRASERPGPGVRDAALVLTVYDGGENREMSMADYLTAAMAGEMPASFETEALKAQAVALRSFALYCREHPKEQHPDADICTDPGCCAAFAGEEELRVRWGGSYDLYRARLEAAAAATDGEYLCWEEHPALAVFHASSRGSTESGADLGLSAPYLCSVDTPETPETVTRLLSSVEVSPDELRDTVLRSFPEARLEGEDPSQWLGAVSLNPAGRVAAVELGGVRISGLTLRQLFSLRSTDFTLAWDDKRGCFLFRVGGYGHGMGMSQYGANLMARAGESYVSILYHYYPGTLLRHPD